MALSGRCSTPGRSHVSPLGASKMIVGRRVCNKKEPFGKVPGVCNNGDSA